MRVTSAVAEQIGQPERLRGTIAWPTLLIAIVLVGVGLGMMIDANFGVAPVDAFFTAVSRSSGLSVGVVLAMLSVLMVLMAWALGARPALGTLVSFLGIGLFVDITRYASAGIGVPEWSLIALIAWWTMGLLIFCVGVAGIFSADRGVSPYDLVTRAVSERTGRSLGIARLIVDAIVLMGAIVLGGSWGAGTVVILVAVPVTLNVLLPRLRAHLLRLDHATR